MRGLVFAFLLLTLTGCASHLSLSSQHCAGAGQWLNETALVGDFTDQKAFDHTFQIISGTGVKELELKELLKDIGINCRKLTSLMVSVEGNALDVTLSFLPFVVLKKLRLRGTYIVDVKNDENSLENLEEEKMKKKKS